MSVHILFEISVTVFKDKDEFGLGMDNVVKADNVDMFEFLHEGDLSDRGGGCSFFCIKMTENDLAASVATVADVQVR